MNFLHNRSEIKNKTIFFFDLDQTIIETVSGKTFPIDVTDFRIRKDFLSALDKLTEIKYFFIVSNQAGLGRFGTSKEEFDAKFASILEFIRVYINRNRKNKIVCKGLYCAAQGANAKNRKPNTGMLERCLKHLTYDKSKIVMIGDASGIHTETRDDFSDSDLRTAKNFDIDYMDIEDFVK